MHSNADIDNGVSCFVPCSCLIPLPGYQFAPAPMLNSLLSLFDDDVRGMRVKARRYIHPSPLSDDSIVRPHTVGTIVDECDGFFVVDFDGQVELCEPDELRPVKTREA